MELSGRHVDLSNLKLAQSSIQKLLTSVNERPQPTLLTPDMFDDEASASETETRPRAWSGSALGLPQPKLKKRLSQLFGKDDDSKARSYFIFKSLAHPLTFCLGVEQGAR